MFSVDRLPKGLRESAYTEPGGEAAWPRRQALEAIDYISGMGSAIYGIEIWLATRPGPTIPTPYIYTWQMHSRRKDEAWEDFVERAKQAAREYVISFSWDANDVAHRPCEPYFNLNVSN